MSDEITRAPNGTADPIQEENAGGSSDHVQKILKEKKNYQNRTRELEEKLAIYEAQLREKEEQELINQKKYQEVAELKKKEADEWKNKFTQSEQRIINATKATAVKSELIKLGLSPDYAPEMIKLADLNSLHYDDESRVVTGAEDQARSLFEKFPPLFGKGKPGVSHDAPQAGGGHLSLQEWKALPHDERIRRESELYASMGIKRTK